MEREAKIRRTGLRVLLGLLFLGVLLAVIWFVTLPAILPTWSNQPGSEQVVQAFRDKGLEVGRSYPVEQEPGWEDKPVPKTYQEATRFEIPSLGADAGGRVFVFRTERNLAAVRDYYDGLPGNIRPYVYVEDGVLLQLNNELSESEAQKYRDVLRDTVKDTA
jgi:hypothetical protein